MNVTAPVQFQRIISKDDNASYHGSSVVGCCDGPESLLSRRVPTHRKKKNSVKFPFFTAVAYKIRLH